MWTVQYARCSHLALTSAGAMACAAFADSYWHCSEAPLTCSVEISKSPLPLPTLHIYVEVSGVFRTFWSPLISFRPGLISLFVFLTIIPLDLFFCGSMLQSRSLQVQQCETFGNERGTGGCFEMRGGMHCRWRRPLCLRVQPTLREEFNSARRRKDRQP